MEYQIIYYRASRTAACEKAINRAMSESGHTMAAANAAPTRQLLGNRLSGAFIRNNLVIVVYNTSQNDKDNLTEILSFAIRPEKQVKCIKIDNGNSYLLSCEGQCLLLLPDFPQNIESILSPDVMKMLQDFLD